MSENNIGPNEPDYDPPAQQGSGRAMLIIIVIFISALALLVASAMWFRS